MTTQKNVFFTMAAVFAVATATVLVATIIPSIEIVRDSYGECRYEINHKTGQKHDCDWHKNRRVW